MFKVLSNTNTTIKNIYPSNIALIKPRNIPDLIKIKSFTSNNNSNVAKEPVIFITLASSQTNPSITTTITFPDLPEIILSIEVGGQKYSLYKPSDNEILNNTITPSPGTFYIIPGTKNVKITAASNQTISPQQQIIIIGSVITFATNEISLPDLLTVFPNITGSVSITQNFNQPPSASLNIICDYNTKNNIETHIKNFNNRINIYGLAFRVANYSVAVKPKKQYPNGEYEFSVGLESWWSYLTGKSVSIFGSSNSANNSSPFADPICRLTNPQPNTSGLSTSPHNPDSLVVNVGTIAGRAGIDYRGASLSFPIPKTTPRDASITFSSAISGDRLAMTSSYLEYTDAVYTRNFSTYTSNTLSEAEVWNVSESNRNYPVTEKFELSIQELPTAVNQSTLTNSLRSRPVFQHNPPNTTTMITGDATANIPPPQARVISVDSCFDISGVVKERGTKTMQGDAVLRETREVYGFAYLGSDFSTYEIQNGKDISSFWRLIESQATDYVYDPRTGYLLGSNTTGSKLQRFLQENPSKMETHFDIDPANVEDLEPFQFQTYPIYAVTAYILREYFGIYKDAVSDSGFIDYQVCNAQGFVETRLEQDPNWVRSRFISDELTEYICFDKIVNPQNRGITNPEDRTAPYYLTTGEEKYLLSRTRVFSSPNTRHNEILVDEMYAGDPNRPGKEDKYIKYTAQQSSQDANYITNGREISEEIVAGKPPEGLRKAPSYELQNNQQVISPTQGTVTPPTRYRYFVTVGVASNTPTQQPSITGSSTTGVTSSIGVNEEEARLNGLTATVAGTRIAVTNTQFSYFQNNDIVNLTTFFDPYKCPGQLVTFQYSFKQYTGRIISNTSVFNIIDSQLVVGETSLTLGSNKTITGSLSSEIDNTTTAPSTSLVVIVEPPASPIGTLAGLSVPSRLNF